MISAPASWTTYNSNLAKDPVLTLEIDGYPRLLSTKKVTGLYNTTNYKLPYPTPVGQYVMWATPTAVEARPDQPGATNGHATGTLTSGDVGMTDSSSLGNVSWAVRWKSFAMPVLPVGAVIQSIIGVFEGWAWDPSNVYNHSFGAAVGNTLLNAWIRGAGGVGFNGPPTGQTSDSGARPTYYSTSIGTTASDVTNASMFIQFAESLNLPPGNGEFQANNPRLAIYFTVPGGSLIGDPWIESIDGLSYDVSPLDGSASLGDVTVTVLDYQRLLTADMASYVLEGRTCRIKTGFVGQDYADYVTLFTGKVDTIPSAEDDVCYAFTLKNALLDLKQLIYQTGDDGQPTDSDHPKTVVGNPLDILKSIALDYLSLDPGRVDSAKMDAYSSQQFAGVQLEFRITSPPEAKTFIEDQIMKPLGGYLRVTNEGVITVNFFTPLAATTSSVKSLTNANMLTIPEANQADLVNVISFRFDQEDSKYNSELVVQDAASVAKYGPIGTNTIQSDGMRSGFQAYFLAKLTAAAIFNRFGNKNPEFDIECFWDCALLEQGDISDVTHALMPDRKAGTLGVTGALFEVQGISYDLSAFTVTLHLVDASFAQMLGHWKVAPDSVPDWTSATTLQKNTYMFISDSVGKYSDATDGHTLA